MAPPQSRLQLLGELHRLDREHAAAVRLHAEEGSSADLWDRYSYGELRVIADFLAADIARLQDAVRGE